MNQQFVPHEPVKNLIRQVIEKKEKENPCFRFMPTLDWYKRVNVGRKQFRRILNNEVQPNVDQLYVIACTLNCSLDELLEFPTEPQAVSAVMEQVA